MKIELKVDGNAEETKVIIITKTVDERIHDLMKRISDTQPQVLAGFDADTVRLLEQDAIIRIYAAAGKVFAVTEKGTYTLRMRLYELEERLDKGKFARISNSEIVNLRKVKSFDLSFTGTIRVSMSNGESTFVSRRYVSKIKQLLGI